MATLKEQLHALTEQYHDTEATKYLDGEKPRRLAPSLHEKQDD